MRTVWLGLLIALCIGFPGVLNAQEASQEALDKVDEIESLVIELRTILKNQEPCPDCPDPDPDPDPDPPNGVVNFPVVSLRTPRSNDELPMLPQAKTFQQVADDTDLILINTDGTIEVLVDVGVGEACMDPFVTYDGKHVLFAIMKGLDYNSYRWMTRKVNSDIYSIDLDTKEVTQLTFQPNDRLVCNTGPAPYGDDRIIYSSELWQPRQDHTPVMQLAVIDRDGTNNTKVGFLNLHGALHPAPMPNGAYMFSSGESMGARTNQWGMWSIFPDGREWGPLMSAFNARTGLSNPFHFACALPNNKIACTIYYQTKNFGMGNVVWFDPSTGFGTPDATKAIPYRDPATRGQIAFAPNGIESLTPLSTNKDNPGQKFETFNNDYSGKWSHPAYAPGGMLMTWSGHSPTNTSTQGGGEYKPTPHMTVCYVEGPKPIESLDDFTIIKTDEEYDYYQAQAVVRYQQVFGIEEPLKKEWLPQNQHAELPLGSPYGIIGTDSMYTRESKPEPDETYNWGAQGSDITGGFENSEIEYVRILGQELSNGKTGSYGNTISERLKVIADIPLRKFNEDGTPKLDSNGDPDTSWWIKLPADQVFTFAILDKDKRQLSLAQTWHQVRPGEVRTNCHGCHAHNEPSTVDFATTEAFKLQPTDLTHVQPFAYDYENDVKPILAANCFKCHDGSVEESIDLVSHMQKVAYAFKLKYNNTPPAIPFQSKVSPLITRLLLPEDDPLHMPMDGGSLTKEEIDIIATWLDTGAMGNNARMDSTHPTLHIESPRRRTTPINKIIFGAADLYGIQSISVTASWLTGEQIGNFTENDGVYTMTLSTPVTAGEVTIKVTDNSGNVTTNTVTFK